MKNYFSYDPEDGFELHETAEAAKKYAEDCIAAYRENAHDGWIDSVEEVCWGELKERSTEIKGDVFNDYGDYHADYQLKAV